MSAGPVCQVWAAGNSTGDCTALRNFFAPPAWYTNLWVGLLAGVIMLAIVVGVTKWHQRPYGRKLEGWTGLIGVLRLPSGPGMIGKMRFYSEKFWEFTSLDGRYNTLVAMTPNSVVQMSQKDGGVSWCMIDGEKRSTVNPDAEAWAEKHLGALAKNHTWPQFVLNWKLENMSRTMKSPQFPRVPSPEDPKFIMHLLYRDGLVRTKEWGQASDEDKEWYRKASEAEAKQLAEWPTLKNKIDAALANSKTYVNQKGEATRFAVGEVNQMVRDLTVELENATGEIASVVNGGRTVTAQMMAGIMRGLPDAGYVMAMRSDFEKRAEEKARKKGDQNRQMVMLIAILLIVAAAAIAIVHFA